MRKVLRVFGMGLGGLLSLLLAAALVVYVWSQIILQRRCDAEPQPMAAAPNKCRKSQPGTVTFGTWSGG